jgi:hypothetical protein
LALGVLYAHLRVLLAGPAGGVRHLWCYVMIEPLVTIGLQPGQEALDALDQIIDSNDLAALRARHGLNQGEVLAMVTERQKDVLLRDAFAELVAELDPR